MAIETINLGTYANDGQGDDLRSAFQKVNSNFTQLDDIVAVDGINLGNGTPVFAGKVEDPGVGDKLTFRTIKAGTNVNLSFDTSAITINAINAIELDPAPKLSADFNLNSNDIIGTGNININGNVTADSFIGNLTGNADTVTNGVYTVGTQIIDGEKIFLHNILGNLTGNADTVTNGVYTSSSINALADVDTQTIPPASGNVLQWNGTKWVPGSGGGGGSGGIGLDFGTFVSPGPGIDTHIDLGYFV